MVPREGFVLFIAASTFQVVLRDSIFTRRLSCCGDTCCATSMLQGALSGRFFTRICSASSPPALEPTAIMCCGVCIFHFL